MDIETLLTGTKWEIIEKLAEKPTSPMELAKYLNTSLANISIQLRLLQTIGIIDKKKITSRAPGKPRALFSISDDYAMISIITEGLAKKRLLKINSKQKEALKTIIK